MRATSRASITTPVSIRSPSNRIRRLLIVAAAVGVSAGTQAGNTQARGAVAEGLVEAVELRAIPAGTRERKEQPALSQAANSRPGPSPARSGSRHGRRSTPVLAEQEWADELTAEDRRALTTLFWSNINPYGRFRLDMDKHLELPLSIVVPGPRRAAEVAARPAGVS
ncbi:hypothetical protein ACFC8F_21180 [Streptomyces hydrogenans]|uniref:hypothetical protein n=1 Tax=Streptomyces hydrogenans TaxID=1873719 RepID=UPI0035D57A3D